MDQSHARTIGETYAGEELHYEIDFWLLKGVAYVTLSFLKGEQKGKYIITLQGQTRGLAGVVSRHREDFYKAVAEEIDGGKRLRSLSFEEYVKIGNKVRRHVHTFDHEKRIWIHETLRGNETRKRNVNEIPPGADYNDFLTAAYNFRYGVYGEIERGKTYNVPVFPRKKQRTYDLKVVPKAIEDQIRKSSSPMKESEFFIELWVDPEILNSTEGLIKGWLSKEIYPVEGKIEDVIFFGDLYGRLVRRIEKK